MAVNINEAQSIVKKLSSEQLIESYKNGSLPQFIVFSEMKSRQDMMKTQPQMPTQTVAESMVGSRDEEPVMAARGGQVYSKMPREIDYYSSLTDAQKKMIASRELPDELSALIAQQTRPDRDYNLARAESYLKDARASTETFRKGGEVEEPPFRMSGKEFADTYLPNLIREESRGVHIKDGKLLKSPAGALGITQIMPGTGANPGFGIKSLRDSSPEAYKDFSKDYLEKAYNIFEGDADKTLTSYNMGIPGVQGAVDRAKKSGGHWREYIPKGEATNYYGKVIGKAQENLPPRQDMAGADTYEPAPVYDNAFLPRGATANDVGIMKNAPGSDKLGSAAYLIKEALKMREGKKEGGPIRLQAGSGASVLRERQREYLNPYIGRPSYESQIPPPPEEPVFGPMGDIVSANNLDEYNRSVADASAGRVQIPPETQDGGPRDTRRFFPFNGDPTSLPPRPIEPKELLHPRSSDMPKDIYPEPPEIQYPRPLPLPESGYSGPEPTSIGVGPQAEQGGPGWAGPDPISIGVGPQVSPAASDPAGTPTKAGPSTGPSAGAGSLAGQLAEIKSLMGNSLSDRSKEVFARDEKILASMQNDKLVNTLMAASAVLAKQRVGSVNYGEAVATAGMAAQEAQGRIVKTEREMNKTRLELAAAQDDRDFKAITTAMTRLNHLDTTNTQLQVAVYNANRAATAQAHSDTRHILANEAAAERARLGQEGSDRRSEVSSLTSQLNGLLRREAIFGNAADQTTSEEKDSVRAEIKAIRTRLNKLSTSRGSAEQTADPTTPPDGFK